MWISDRNDIKEKNKQLIWRVLYGSSGITLKVFVQSLPLKDIYTRAISYQWHRGRFTSSNTVFMAALSRIWKKTKTKTKHEEWKWMLLHFLLHPVLETVKAKALYPGFTSAVPFATCKTTPSLEEPECPTLSLNSLLSNGHWRWDRVQTFTAKEAFVNRAMNRQKENNRNSHWFVVFIHPLPQFSFFFFLKSKLYGHSPGDFGRIWEQWACNYSCNSSDLREAVVLPILYTVSENMHCPDAQEVNLFF